MSANSWADLIATAVTCKEDKVPIGFKTAVQIGLDENVPERTVRRKLNIAFRDKMVERKEFRIKHQVGGIKLTPHYKLINSK